MRISVNYDIQTLDTFGREWVKLSWAAYPSKQQAKDMLARLRLVSPTLQFRILKTVVKTKVLAA